MNSMGKTLSIALLLCSDVSLGSTNLPNNQYGASVAFENGECWYWTGDAGLTAEQFRNDLKERFDTSKGISIRHAIETPRRCVRTARRMARLAGFKVVKNRANAGPIAPPIVKR